MPQNNIQMANWPQQSYQNPASGIVNQWNSMNQPASNFQTTNVQQPTIVAPKQLLHYVNNEQEIIMQDIPMNGDVAFFVRGDLKEIYAKKWQVDGVHGNTYVLKEDPQQPNPQDPFTTIMERLDRIEKSLQRGSYRPKPRSNNRSNAQNNQQKEEET